MRYGLSSVKRWSTVLMLVAVAVALPKPVSAQEVVTITEVTFFRFGWLTAGAPEIAVSITCDATGIIGDLVIDAEQGDRIALTNSDLLNAPCTTMPTRYVIQLFCGECDFQPGPLVVTRATAIPGGEFGSGQRILLRRVIAADGRVPVPRSARTD
jgi:hypothetical protein